MKKRYYVFAFTCIFAIALCACGKKEVKYQPDSQATQSDAEDEEGGNKLEGGLAKSLGVEETIVESITTDEGETIKIYGDVKVPDIDGLNVYEATKKSFDDMEVRKSIVEKVSDDGKIYSAKEEQLPAYILTRRAEDAKINMQMWEKLMQEDPDYKDDYQRYLQEEKENYEKYQSLAAKAGDEFVEATYEDWKEAEAIQYTEENYNYMETWVIILRDGNPWYLRVDEYDGMTMTAVDYRDYFPEKANDYTAIEGGVFKNGIGKKVDENTQTAYVDPANEFVQSLEIGEFTSQGLVSDASFYGITEEKGRQEPEGLGDCGARIVAFSRDLDGMLMDSDSYWGMITYENAEEANNSYPVEKYLSEEIIVCVGANGEILGMNLKGLVDTPSVQTQGVALLNFEQIKAAIFNQLQTNPPSDANVTQEGGSIKYNPLKTYGDLTLKYFRMPDEDNEDAFTILPVWALKAQTGDEYSSVSLIINAMDGSVIDPGKVLYRKETWEEKNKE